MNNYDQNVSGSSYIVHFLRLNFFEWNDCTVVPYISLVQTLKKKGIRISLGKCSKDCQRNFK